MSDVPICRRCGQALNRHGLFFDDPTPEQLVGLTKAEFDPPFDFGVAGAYCPSDPTHELRTVTVWVVYFWNAWDDVVFVRGVYTAEARARDSMPETTAGEYIIEARILDGEPFTPEWFDPMFGKPKRNPTEQGEP